MALFSMIHWNLYLEKSSIIKIFAKKASVFFFGYFSNFMKICSSQQEIAIKYF